MRTFSLGMLLALVELIPGISAASIALIFGIYERIVKVVAQITFKNIFLLVHLLSLHRKKSQKIVVLLVHKFDLKFVFLLLLGQLVTFLLFPSLLSYLLKNYAVYILALFFVFILFSFKNFYQSYKEKINFSISWFVLGCMVFFLLKSIIGEFHTIEIHSYQYFFLGLLIVCFMMLPGISGSFVLLLLGQYDIMISLLSHLLQGNNLGILCYFICGIICGAILFARMINYFFGKFFSASIKFFTSLGLYFFFRIIFMKIHGKEIITFFFCFLFFFCFFYGFSNYFNKKIKKL